MRSESEIAQLTTTVQRVVDEQIARGAPAYPTTVLERHAFELGRLSVLKWVNPTATAPDVTTGHECGGLGAVE